MGIKLIAATSKQKEQIAALNQIVLKHYSNVGIGNMCKYAIFRMMPVPFLKLGLVLRTILKGKDIDARKYERLLERNVLAGPKD